MISKIHSELIIRQMVRPFFRAYAGSPRNIFQLNDRPKKEYESRSFQLGKPWVFSHWGIPWCWFHHSLFRKYPFPPDFQHLENEFSERMHPKNIRSHHPIAWKEYFQWPRYGRVWEPSIKYMNRDCARRKGARKDQFHLHNRDQATCWSWDG